MPTSSKTLVNDDQVRDKYGRSMSGLLALQVKELRQWKRTLKPDVYLALTEWCELVNGPMNPHKRSLHSCPVGCELHHFIMAYGVRKLSASDEALLG